MAKLFMLILTFSLGVATTLFFTKHYEIHNGQIIPIAKLSFADASVYGGDLNAEGILEGQGRLSWPNGAYYEGGFKNGLFHGKGKFVNADGTQYEGDYVNGVEEGQGKIIYPSNTIYEGEFKDGLIHGQGKIIYDDGVHYEGTFNNEKPSGNGKLVRPGEYTYVGSFENALFHGKGNISYENGNSYVGDFKYDLKHGNGIYQTSDGKMFSGEFFEGSFTGNGSLKEKEDISFVGEFQDWSPHGKSVKVDEKGNQWEGNFEYGALYGKGTYIGKDGTRYTGEFQHDMYHGEGELISADGDIYRGSFSYGQKDGEGSLHYKEPVDGISSFKGRWENGTLVEGDESLTIHSSEEISEFVVYHQADLLEQSLQALSPADPNKIELYTLGIAGYGDQEVFRREINFIEELFDRQYNNEDQSLYLSNSRRSLADRPLATITSIEKSIQRLSETMNKDQDILFIYITSHGSKDKQISLQQSGINLPDLSSESLATFLKDSGIKHKIIVLSACYSGGFIDDLKDNNTLIMTSSADNRASFGCSDERQFTHFGKAFFKESLDKNMSFLDAFDNAKVLIEGWEDEGNIKNSNPQIHKPEAIVSYLKQWQEIIGNKQLTLADPPKNNIN